MTFWPKAYCLSMPTVLALLFSSGCSNEERNNSKNMNAGAKQHAGLENSPLETLGEGYIVRSGPVGLPDPNAAPFTLTPEASHDGYEFTFGVAAFELPALTEDSKIIVTRGLLNGSGRVLTSDEKSSFARICRDIGLSSSPDSYVNADSISKNQKLYLMWRSYYAAPLRSLLSEMLMRGGGIECILSLDLGGKKLNIGFDPTAPDSKGLGGVQKLEEAVKLGLMIPKTFGVLLPEDSESFLPITDAPRIVMQIAPLASTQYQVKASQVLTNECALSTEGGKTHVANPYAVNVLQYELANSSGVNITTPVWRTTGGRLLEECKGLRLEQVENKVLLHVSCGQYQAIKDQGVEAACGFDFVVSNNKDPENTASVPVQMNKIRYRSVDVNKVSEAIQLMPKSFMNPLRNSQLKLSGFSRTQAGAFEDLFDLWIALDQEGFMRDFSGQVKKIVYSTTNGCSQGAGAYTPYGGDTIYWCLSGGMGEADVAKRYNDPQMFLYRAMLAYHETRHAKNIFHDYEQKAYLPCQGTSYSGFLAYQVVTQCDYDYCKVMRDGAIADYKLELNYDYSGDTTGRKAQGLCKEWSQAMGITGGGF